MMKTPNRSTGLAVSALALTLMLAACGNDEPEPEEEPTPSPTASDTQEPDNGGAETEAEPQPEDGPASDEPEDEESPADTAEEAQGADEAPDPPDVSSAGDNIQNAAEAYLYERENQQSYYHEEASGWLDDIEQFMTEDGFSELQDRIPEDGRVGDAWRVAEQNNLAVAVELGECVVYEAAGIDEDDHKVVQCPLMDIVVDEDGDPVATTDIPPVWPYVGPQTPATLEMMLNDDDDWVVHADRSGQAG